MKLSVWALLGIAIVVIVLLNVATAEQREHLNRQKPKLPGPEYVWRSDLIGCKEHSPSHKKHRPLKTFGGIVR
jgi:hypothetical protein